MIALGDYAVGDTITFHFTTHLADGTPATLSGATLAIYKGNSAAESVIGVTLNVDFDFKTGLNQVAIDTSQPGGFFAPSLDYSAILTAGVVGGISVVGYVVARFSLARAVLGSAGLDAVVIESGLNARQALALITAAEAGNITAVDGGSGSWTFTVKGAGVATTRIVAIANNETKARTATLTPPA